MNADYKMNLDQFAAELSRLLDRPVIDKAGIAGTFDLHFEFVVDEPTSALMPGGAWAAAAPAEDAVPGPSIFAALQEQLGLNLQPAKGPEEFLVIDSIERPSEN
jgi:uncharacterized protein (TIGR03435 family)